MPNPLRLKDMKNAINKTYDSILKKSDKNSPYYLYSQSEIHLQWAFSRLKFDDYISAAYEFVRAYYLLERNIELYPDFVLNKKGLGVLHSVLGVVPDKYHWILNAAGLRGDVDLGLSELNIVLNNKECEMYKHEILFLVSFLQIHLRDNQLICKDYLGIIDDGYKTHHLLSFAAARLSHALGDNDYCLRVLENRPSSIGKYPFYFLDYLHGMAYLYKLDYDKADKYLTYYINKFKGLNYIKSSYHKLAWIAELNGDFKKKKYYFDMTVSQGNELIDIDKVALKEAKKKYISHPSLLKARLCYDGGYYQKALSELENIENLYLFSNNENAIEYWYRMGRIFQKMERTQEKTISFFEKAITIGINSHTYYVPMSTLQIAIEYERTGDNKKANAYYNKCLKMKGFDYQRGIHQKAKAGLARVKD